MIRRPVTRRMSAWEMFSFQPPHPKLISHANTYTGPCIQKSDPPVKAGQRLHGAGAPPCGCVRTSRGSPQVWPAPRSRWLTPETPAPLVGPSKHRQNGREALPEHLARKQTRLEYMRVGKHTQGQREHYCKYAPTHAKLFKQITCLGGGSSCKSLSTTMPPPLNPPPPHTRFNRCDVKTAACIPSLLFKVKAELPPSLPPLDLPLRDAAGPVLAEAQGQHSQEDVEGVGRAVELGVPRGAQGRGGAAAARLLQQSQRRLAQRAQARHPQPRHRERGVLERSNRSWCYFTQLGNNTHHGIMEFCKA